MCEVDAGLANPLYLCWESIEAEIRVCYVIVRFSRPFSRHIHAFFNTDASSFTRIEKFKWNWRANCMNISQSGSTFKKQYRLNRKTTNVLIIILSRPCWIYIYIYITYICIIEFYHTGISYQLNINKCHAILYIVLLLTIGQFVVRCKR